MKKIFLLLFIISLSASSTATAAESDQDRPHWSLEIKGGLLVPAFKEWSSFYGKRDTGRYGGSLAYKFLNQVEAGIEASSTSAAGHGVGLLHQTPAGDVTTDLYPLNVFLLLRGVFQDNQLLVPYIGGGWTRLYYRQEIENQGVARGKTDGYHIRGGIQLLLDTIDPDAAINMYNDYGIFHTYFFMEAEYIRADIDTVSHGSVDLGGKSWMGGLLFEF